MFVMSLKNFSSAPHSVSCHVSTILVHVDVESENFEVSQLPKETLNTIEADSFWCTSKLLDGIQDNYTFAQPGIQMKVCALQELVKRIDGQSSV